MDSVEHTTTLELLERLVAEAAPDSREDLNRSVEVLRLLLGVKNPDGARDFLQELLLDAHHD